MCIRDSKKGRDFLARAQADLRAAFVSISDTPSALEITPAARLAVDGFLGGGFSSVPVSYTHLDVYKRQTTMTPPPGPRRGEP